MSTQYTISTSIDIKEVLIVDDKKGGRDFFQDVIQELQRKPIVKESALDALEEIRNIQMIICAWEMKHMSGATFVQKALNKEPRKIPFLIYSQKLQDQDIALIKETGIKNVVKMPLNKGEILEIIEQIIEKDAVINPVEDQLIKAKALAKKKQYKEAFDLLKPHEKDSVLGCDIKTLMAELRIKRNQPVHAETLLDEILAKNPGHPPAVRLKANILTSQGKTTEAIAMLETLHEQSPLNIDHIVALGDTYLADGQCEKAADKFKRAAELDDSNPDHKLKIVSATAQGGDVHSAITFLSQMGISEDYAKDLNNVAISLSRTGQTQRALAMYQTALSMIKKQTARSKVILNIGLAYSRLNQHEQAFDTLAGLYVENPGMEKAYALMAREFQILNKQESGVSNLDQDLVAKVKAARKKHKSAS